MELLIKKKVSSGRWDEIKPDENKTGVPGYNCFIRSRDIKEDRIERGVGGVLFFSFSREESNDPFSYNSNDL